LVSGTSADVLAVVNVRPIMAALCDGAARLSSCALSANAPPAFLLDGDRRRLRGADPAPGSFDNRSISLPTDFPSGTLLVSRGVRRAVLVQESGHEPQVDLAHTLLRWQSAGIEISVLGLRDATGITKVLATKPPLFRRMWYAVLATAGLRRSPFGGFGGTLPLPSVG
jgi:hypothetical protein